MPVGDAKTVATSENGIFGAGNQLVWFSIQNAGGQNNPSDCRQTKERRADALENELLRIETIRDFSALEALRDEWEALDASLALRMPFTSPIWGLNWWRSFQRHSLAARDRLNCYALRDPQGMLIALAPMFVTERPGFGPVRVRELQFFGADPYVTEWRGVICRPDRENEAFTALAARIAQERPANSVQWRGLPALESGHPVEAGLSTADQMGTSVFYLALPDSWDAFRQGLSRNIKESLRKCYNSLSRDKLEAQLHVVSAPEETDAALDKFFDLHSMRADAAGTIDHPNVFDAPNARDFLRRVCLDFAGQDRLRIFQLTIDGKTVATRIGFLMGDQIFMYFSGYDLEWGRYSVMTTTVAEAIKWSIANRLRIFNLSTGQDVSKTRWRPERVDFRGGYSVSGQLPQRMAVAALHALRERMRPRDAKAIVAPTT